MSIEVRDGFVVNPTVEVTPTIRISPFMECDLGMVAEDATCAKDYLNQRFHSYCLTIKAREAIKVALTFYDLSTDDVVTIFTTSNNYYVSGCVTRTIETMCKWSREITEKTKVILVIHEFGYPCPNMKEILQYGLPIIEDCALSFASNDQDRMTGKTGDFAIYSLPKFFPMQIGGVLVSHKYDLSTLSPQITEEQESFILRSLSLHVPLLSDMLQKRMNNYEYLQENLSGLGVQPFFSLVEGTYPAVYLFKWAEDMDYSLLKEYMQGNGIEASVFYGKSAFFVPIHHRLNKQHLDYIITLLKQFAP